MTTCLTQFLLAATLISLVACGGSSEQEPVAVGPEPTPVPTPIFNSLASCGINQYTATPLAQPLATDFATVVMGSSSAAGAGATKADLSWAGLYASWRQSTGGVTTNIARGGHTTYQALPQYCLVPASRLEPDVAHNVEQALTLQPDLVLISYPSNDAALGWSAQESVGNILVLRSVLADAGVASVVLGAQPRNLSANRSALLQEFDRLLQQQVPQCVVPLYNLLQSNNKLNPLYDSGDGVHLNDAGHAVVFAALQQLLEQGKCVLLPE